MRDIRQSSPFGGVLTQGERSKVIRARPLI